MFTIINILYLLLDFVILYDYLIQFTKQLFPISYLNRSMLMWPPGHFTLIGYLFCGNKLKLSSESICPVSLRRINQDTDMKMYLSLFPQNICFRGI